MNLAQRILLTVALVGVMILVLFPPWFYVYHHDPPRKRPGESEQRFERPAGMHSLWGANVPSDPSALGQIFNLANDNQFPDRLNLKYFSMRIDKDRLGIALIGILIATAILYYLLRSREREREAMA